MENNHIIALPDLQCEWPTKSLGEVFYEKMKMNQHVVAQIVADTNEEDTYGELLQRSIRTAIRLKERGVNKEDLIGSCTDNHINSSVPFIAAQFLGVPAITWDIKQPLEEKAKLFRKITPKIIFISENYIQHIEEALKKAEVTTQIVVFGESKTHTKFSDFLQPHDDEVTFRPVVIKDNKQTACIVLSSGTSGLPKGICLNHFSLLSQLQYRKYVENLDYELLKEESVRVSQPFKFLSYTSLYWISSCLLLIGAIESGCCRILCKEFNEKDALSIASKHKVLVLTLTPWQVVDICKVGRPKDLEFTSPIRINVIGSAISEKQIRIFKKLVPEADIFSTYAMTEATGLITVYQVLDKRHRELMKEKLTSCGLPVPGISYKVVDPESGQTLGPNQKGELRFKSKLLMNGYYNQDSSQAFDENGWLKTGDIVYYDDELCFYIVDRIKDIFKYKGYHIQPIIIEEELMKHPEIKLAAVVGVPHEQDDNHVMGFVTLKDDASVSESELVNYISSRLEDLYHLRAGLRIVDAIPVTPTGKIKKKQLLDLALKQ